MKAPSTGNAGEQKEIAEPAAGDTRRWRVEILSHSSTATGSGDTHVRAYGDGATQITIKSKITITSVECLSYSPRFFADPSRGGLTYNFKLNVESWALMFADLPRT